MLCGFFHVGASIRACRSVGQHIVALEENKELFSTLLVPMVRSPAVSSPPQPQVLLRSQDPDAMEIVPATMEIVSAKIKKRHAGK
jgi:hypothetical protein